MSDPDHIVECVVANATDLRDGRVHPLMAQQVAGTLANAVEAIPASDGRRLPAQLLNATVFAWAGTLRTGELSNVIEEPVWADLAAFFMRIIGLRAPEATT